jgi:hypothetical protein
VEPLGGLDLSYRSVRYQWDDDRTDKEVQPAEEEFHWSRSSRRKQRNVDLTIIAALREGAAELWISLSDRLSRKKGIDMYSRGGGLRCNGGKRPFRWNQSPAGAIDRKFRDNHRGRFWLPLESASLTPVLYGRWPPRPQILYFPFIHFLSFPKK